MRKWGFRRTKRKGCANRGRSDQGQILYLSNEYLDLDPRNKQKFYKYVCGGGRAEGEGMGREILNPLS